MLSKSIAFMVSVHTVAVNAATFRVFSEHITGRFPGFDVPVELADGLVTETYKLTLEEDNDVSHHPYDEDYIQLYRKDTVITKSGFLGLSTVTTDKWTWLASVQVKKVEEVLKDGNERKIFTAPHIGDNKSRRAEFNQQREDPEKVFRLHMSGFPGQ